MSHIFKRLRQPLICLSITLAFAWGFYGLMTFALPLKRGDYRQAIESRVANESEVLINGATAAYDAGNYDEAVKVLDLALNNLLDKSGRYSKADAWKVERVHFLLGKTYQRMKKFDKAIEEYKETLRINPDHYAAKYNLEMLIAGGGGGGDGQPKPGKIKPKI